MHTYLIRLQDAGGSTLSEILADYADDDRALDAIGRHDHQGAIEVLEAGRLVGRFPPVGRRSWSGSRSKPG